MNFVKVKKIEPISHDGNLYDIETKTNHNFFANDILVHNSNFSFITDGKTVKVASREQLTDGSFYKSQAVIDRYAQAVMDLKNQEFPDAGQLQLYGELFGPGIQSGVFYGTNKEFMAFELSVDGVPEISNATMALTQRYGIPHAPIIGTFASLDEALELSPVFTSRVYDTLHPDDNFCTYDSGENLAEGIVLKPAIDVLYTPNGSRVFIKNKHPNFSEKKNRRRTDKGEGKNQFIEIANQYVNGNRMNAVISKEGEVAPKDYGRIIQLMCADVIIDMVRDGDLPEDWKTQEEFKMAGKGVAAAVSAFLKVNLLPKL
jgi:Rnl2 family RNA ligase